MNTRTTSRRGVLDALITDEVVSSRKSVGTVAVIGVRTSNDLLLTEISSAVPISQLNGYKRLVNFAPSADKPIHRWFWYREGYSQELVRDFIKELPKGSVVLDPFCGAGTTLIAAREMDYPSIGFDVNPISTLVSRVKTTPLDNNEIEVVKNAVNDIIKARKDFAADSKPALKIIDKIYDEDVLNALLVFRKLINKIAPQTARDFVFVAWLSILEKMSNVYKEGNGIKYRNRKRTEDGYIRVDLNLWANASLPVDRMQYVKEHLVAKIQQMLGDIAVMPIKAPASVVIEGGAEHIQEYVAANSVALAIFSPPYCNCFNYFKMYKVELWMGGFVDTYQELRTLNRRGLRSHVETVLKRAGDKNEPEVEPFAQLLDKTELWDKRIPNAVRGYFIDMAQVLRGLHAVLKPSGKCTIVVGNSAYGGVVIPTDALLARIAESIGFKVERLAVARHLTTSSQQRAHLGTRGQYLRESILVLVKEDPRLVDRELEVVDEIPLDDSVRREKVFLIRNSGLTAGTHKFHRYPGKFIPHIPRWALQRYSTPGQAVLDPFCGSGTTLVEAMLHGANAVGIDVDPIAKLVSRVKTNYISRSEIDTLSTDISASIRRRRRARFRPSIPTLTHWFNEQAIQGLGIIRDEIEEYRHNTLFYEFLLVCLVSIIRRVSNADNQTQKTYVSHTKPKTPESAIPLFLNTLVDYGRRVSSLPAMSCSAKAYIMENSSALEFSNQWSEISREKFGLIITSPPYLNSVDYIYNQMAEYFWIGDLYGLENQSKQNDHKRRYVGTTSISMEEYSTPIITGIAAVDEIAAKVRKKDRKSGYIVEKYFSDMVTHFREAVKVLATDGKYVSVVGDSLISGEPILVHEILGECAAAAGFVVTDSFGYEIRNRHMRFPRMGRGGIVRYDWVLELSKSK